MTSLHKHSPSSRNASLFNDDLYRCGIASSISFLLVQHIFEASYTVPHILWSLAPYSPIGIAGAGCDGISAFGVLEENPSLLLHPPWALASSFSMFHTFGTRSPTTTATRPNPPRRPRVNKSCSECTRRKVKCDGGQPCSTCQYYRISDSCAYHHRSRRQATSRR
jgi:hypothetical protein